MKKVVVTGAGGFIGKNLIEHLKKCDDIIIYGYDIDNDLNTLESYISQADFVFHLAGVNRPLQVNEFENGNKILTEKILGLLTKHNRKTGFVFSSSIQVNMDNPYGISKRHAEEAVFSWAKETGAEAFVFCLPNVFGKWCRPNYNSVVATFCYNIARGLPIQISNPSNELTLVYIDEVVEEFMKAIYGNPDKRDDGYCYIPRSYKITLGELADKINFFRTSRSTLVLPNFEDDFTRFLYATYVSYLPEEKFGYPVEMKRDNRGWLAEILKSGQFGQIFVSKTKPGVIRGNHWHHTKVEKFIVISGQAIIRFRHIHGDKTIEFRVNGDELKVVDIPTGYSHSIENVGNMDLITLFWSDEIFNPNNPDTYFREVLPAYE